jgi:hypothetical protein
MRLESVSGPNLAGWNKSAELFWVVVMGNSFFICALNHSVRDHYKSNIDKIDFFISGWVGRSA